ncbi:MAG: heme exporter protein CcmD [Candidatus Binataceae bacterium]
MDHLGYLGAAYGIFFVVIFLYVVFLWRRQHALEVELRALESRFKSRESATVAGGGTRPPTD